MFHAAIHVFNTEDKKDYINSWDWMDSQSKAKYDDDHRLLFLLFFSGFDFTPYLPSLIQLSGSCSYACNSLPVSRAKQDPRTKIWSQLFFLLGS